MIQIVPFYGPGARLGYDIIVTERNKNIKPVLG